MKHFSKFDINKEDLRILNNYNSRDGFVVLEEPEFQDMLDYFGQYEIYKNLIPILTDNNSNYWCLYVDAALRGMICYVSHDELSLEPKFKGVSELINAIDNNQDAYDFEELDEEVFDFPMKRDSIQLNNDREILNTLLAELEVANQEDVRQQLAFSIMALASKNEIESIIYPFLDNENMHIQERAIQLIGFHKYRPARNKLIELTKTAMVNGKAAAGKALKELNKVA